ncbi:MAG: glycosyltransferase [Selenomonas sp.]|nr:glycosyltransferase [Selenomonas sp.]
MKIIGCYIVKNEAEALSRSLASIKDQVDEIVVVDTGSTDHTAAAAARAGAKIHRFPWQDDFALARNFALDKLTGDWVVFLDADEYFSAETAKNLRQVITTQGRDTNLLLVQRQDVDETGATLMTLYVPRVFRIDKDLRYEGAIHEELRQQGRQVTGIAAISPQELKLIHTGYAGALGEAKARRNLQLLQKEMSKSSQPERYYGYLAEAYDGLEDRDNAMKYAYLDIARGRQAETYASRSYRLLLEKLAEHKRDYLERQRVAKLAVRDFPELPEFHAELAESLAAGWQYLDAANAMQKALVLGKAYQGLEPSLFDVSMAKQCQKRQQLFAQLAEVGSSLKITACVIAKNEAANIKRWLDNAQIYADECILLDTGSTDNTCELAKGAQIHHYEWQDDFAAARNKALEYVTGDWVAFLDADEYFARPQEVRGALAELVYRHSEADALRVTIRNVDADDGQREISRFCNIRLFRNKPELRYVGRVHENLEHITGKAVKDWEEPQLEIMHTGYSSHIVLDKTRRNLALLQADIAERGEHPGHYRYLADCYYMLGDYRQAQLYALQAIDAPLKGQGTHGDMYYMVLLCMKALEEPAEEILAFAEAASRMFPSRPDFMAVQGLVYYQNGDYTRGQERLARACKLAAASDGHESSSFGDLAAMVYAAKAGCEAHLGNYEQALQDSRQAMEINPGEELALEVFCVLHQADGWPALMEKLQAYFPDRAQDGAYLGRFAERQGLGGLYAYYRQEMPRKDYYALLEAGKWPELLEKLQIGLGKNMEIMTAILMRLAEQQGNSYRQLERQLTVLLPADLQNVWCAVRNGNVPANWPVYQILWNYALDYGSDEQIARIGELALDNAEIWPSVLAALMEREKWQTAAVLLARIPQERADGDFWLNLGRCLYHLGEDETAEEALERARQQGIDNFLLQSYEIWLKNKKTLKESANLSINKV